MICQVSDGRRRGFRRSVAARCRAGGRQVFSGESELPERPVEGRHERRQKRQVIPATFCDFFSGIFLGIVGRQHGVGCHLRLPRHSAWGCRAPGCGSRRVARRRRPRRPSQPAPIRSWSAARWQCSPIRQRCSCRAMQVRRGTPLRSSRRLRDPSSLTVSTPVTAFRVAHPAALMPIWRFSIYRHLGPRPVGKLLRRCPHAGSGQFLSGCAAPVGRASLAGGRRVPC